MEQPTIQLSRRKLLKSESDLVVDGVCAGIADYLHIDPTVVRLVVLTLFMLSPEATAIFYVAAMIVIPKPSVIEEHLSASNEENRSGIVAAWNSGMYTGIAIIIVGLAALFRMYDFFPIASIWRTFQRLALPIMLILIGGALLLEKSDRSGGIEREAVSDEQTFRSGRLARASREKRISGVCGGLAEYFGVDATVVRLFSVLLAIASFGWALALYVVCAVALPKEKD